MAAVIATSSIGDGGKARGRRASSSILPRRVTVEDEWEEERRGGGDDDPHGPSILFAAFCAPSLSASSSSFSRRSQAFLRSTAYTNTITRTTANAADAAILATTTGDADAETRDVIDEALANAEASAALALSFGDDDDGTCGGGVDDGGGGNGTPVLAGEAASSSSSRRAATTASTSPFGFRSVRPMS